MLSLAAIALVIPLPFNNVSGLNSAANSFPTAFITALKLKAALFVLRILFRAFNASLCSVEALNLFLKSSICFLLTINPPFAASARAISAL